MERWLPVVGYEGLYEVSDRGRVRSVHHEATGAPRLRLPEIVAQVSTLAGRMTVKLRGADGKRGRRFVHVLVLMAFKWRPV